MIEDAAGDQGCDKARADSVKDASTPIQEPGGRGWVESSAVAPTLGTAQEIIVLDLIYVAATVAFFVLCTGFGFVLRRVGTDDRRPGRR